MSAQLNKAWNVLSDPYQRGRYDEQRVAAGGDASATTSGDEDDDERGRRPPRGAGSRVRNDRADKRRKAPASRSKPTIALPPRTHFPSTRHRIIAMVIDLFVLLVLFIGSQFVRLFARSEPSTRRSTTTSRRCSPDKISKADNASSKANKAASTADKALAQLKATTGVEASQIAAAQATATAADNAAKHAKDEVTALNKQLTKESNVLAPISSVVHRALLRRGSALPACPEHPPHRSDPRQAAPALRRRRAIDGSPVERGRRCSAATALLVLVAYMLFAFLEPDRRRDRVVRRPRCGLRNPNKQGLHDRFAKRSSSSTSSPDRTLRVRPGTGRVRR